MKNSLKNFTHSFEERLTGFLWKEWSALGVLGTSTAEVRWVIDPEALLLLTSEIARHEPRLFDEVLDWLRFNSRWINTQRLRMLHEKQRIGDPHVVAAIARLMMRHDPAAKWQKLSQVTGPRAPAEALFLRGRRAQLSVVHEPDPDFGHYGLLRPPLSQRSLSRPVPMKQAGALDFRLRALFGLGMRADILCYLLTHESAHPSGVARALGYSQKRVQDTMIELAESGQLSVRSSGRLKIYGLDHGQWTGFLAPGEAKFPAWIDWIHLACGLTSLWRGIWALDPGQTDEYAASSAMRSLMRSVRDELLASGAGFKIQDDRDHLAEKYLPVFIADVQKILDVLDPGP